MNFTQDDIDAALRTLEPQITPQEIARATETCVLEAGFVGEVIVSDDGSVEFRGRQTEAERNQTIIESCNRSTLTSLPPTAEVASRELELAALYELQRRAASCVEDKLGLDANLPSLETYIDSDGDWNMYDHAIATSDVEPPPGWDEWQKVCPQDVWHYYGGIGSKGS